MSVLDPECCQLRPLDPSNMDRAKSRLEYSFVFLIFLLFSIVLCKAAINGAAQGQDFVSHADAVRAAAQDPLGWTFQPQNRTNPPLYHLAISIIYQLTDGPENEWIRNTGIFNAFLNICSLGIIYIFARSCIKSIVVRLSFLAFIAFLPANIATSLVLAADAPAQFLFLLFAMLLWKGIDSGIQRGWLPIAGASLVLLIAISTKFTSISLLVASALVLTVVAVTKRVSLRGTLLALAILVAPNAVVATLIFRQNPKNYTDHFNEAMGGMNPPPAKMNLRSLLWFRSGDLRLLKAPSYGELATNDPPDQPSLYASNTLSYPGLLVYGTFSDPLNILQTKVRMSGARSTANQKLMQVSVILGSASFILCVAGCVAAFSRLSFALLRRRETNLLLFVVATCAVAWHGVILLGLVQATMGYLYGYWLPRLILPSLLCYALLAFSALDAAVRRWPRTKGIVTFHIGAVSALQLLWLWA